VESNIFLFNNRFAFVRDNLEPGSSIVKFDFEFYALDTDKYALSLMQKVP
jgi:hypothetical protein